MLNLLLCLYTMPPLQSLVLYRKFHKICDLIGVWPFFNCLFIVTSFYSEWPCHTDWRYCTEFSWVQVVTGVSCSTVFKDSQVFINESGIRWCLIFTALKLEGLICCSFPGTVLVLWVLKSSLMVLCKIWFRMPKVPGLSKA